MMNSIISDAHNRMACAASVTVHHFELRRKLGETSRRSLPNIM